MNILHKRILGASLTLAAFSFITATQVAAQTCVTPPTCESLGYNKTTADCEGKTILKCPFDTSQVYCPGNGEEGQGGSYALGDTYYANGSPVGKVIKLDCSEGTTCSHGIVSTTGIRSGTYTQAHQSCAAMSTGGLTWYLASKTQISLIGRYIGFSGYVWGNDGNCVGKYGVTKQIDCYGTPHCDNTEVIRPCKSVSEAPDLILSYYCIAAF